MNPPTSPLPPPPQPPSPPRRSRTGLWIGLGAGAAALLLCCLVGCVAMLLIDTDDDTGAAAGDPTTEVTAPDDDADAEQDDGLRLEIVAEHVEFEPASEFDTGEQHSVRVEVTNVSDERVYVGPLDWFAETSDGVRRNPEYPRHVDALPGMYLDPGQTNAGVITFGDEVETVFYQRWPSEEPVPATIE